ncbi:gastrula zinc finger protein XlCGF26.1-like [Homarus americanus]|uniref:gastrula zinc finger protein XlCGF26.1-like n=1 Tax=Homarus americanus TaxID=6706 RepID=UPI001C43D2F8|nr:gastrula zinc finger protein XlCGF26.1-like [Homarus americanus]
MTDVHKKIYTQPDENDEFCKEPEQAADINTKFKSDDCASRECRPANCTLENDKASYECEICGKMFLDLRSCQSHIRGVHHEASQMCKFCGKMFKRRCDLYQHERRHNTANLPCKLCGKIFKLPKDLTAHMTTHIGGKRFNCIHCNKELTSFRNLRNHIASIHQKQRAFVCQMCSKTYSKSCSLQVHIRSVHTGERPFKCSVCSKSFCDSALLRLHNAVHTGERKYSCKVCERRFNQYSNMISHQRVHTNHRPFTCVICKENFKTREGLLKHKWIHTGLKPLQCRHCSKEFRIKESYERHMLKCHNEVISLPEIYFEMPEESISEEPSKTTSSNSVRVFKSIGDSKVQEPASVCISSNRNEKIIEKKTFNKDSPQDMGLVVHFVQGVTQVESSPVHLTTNDSGQMQLNYPLLSSTANAEENEILSSNANIEENSNITLENLANQISCSDKVTQSIDVESLLHENVEVPGIVVQ